MEMEGIKQNLQAIRNYVSGIEGIKESLEVEQMNLEHHMIEKTINQMERKGLHIPKGLVDEKTLLESKLDAVSKGPKTVLELYEDLLAIIIEIGIKIRRRPDRDIYRRIKAQRKQIVSRDVLRKTMIEVLKGMGGSGHQRDVLKAVEEKLKDQLGPADMERQFGKSCRWETNARKERDQMLKEGLLTKESKGSEWTLQR